jgi:CheY-like chemotaxis protein
MNLLNDTPAAARQPLMMDAPLTHIPPRLLGKVGEAFASGLTALQTTAHSAPEGPLRELLLHEISRLQGLGLQVQQVARVLGHEGSRPLESIDLLAAVREVLSTWATRWPGHTVHNEAQSGPRCWVETNGAVLEQLLELALVHAAELGHTLTVAVHHTDPLTPARLQLHITRDNLSEPLPGDTGAAPLAPNDAQAHDTVSWLLLQQLARASGLTAERRLQAHAAQLVLPLARATLKQWADHLPTSTDLPNTPVALGCRVLLVEPHRLDRLQARELLLAAGMHIDAADGPEQALQFSRDRLPDVLITGLPASEPALARLISALQERQPRLCVIELVNGGNGLVFAGPDTPGQVSRDDMTHTLVAAVSQELAMARS